MRINHTQRKWMVASLLILGGSTAFYVQYARRELQGPRGGTPIGLAFGGAGLFFIVFAALLGARNRVPVWRLGRAQTWMRGHLWLAPLSLPLILFHAGFHFGGALTTALMVLLIIAVASGILGAVLQHLLPRLMTRELPLETIYEQIDSIRAQMLEEADQIVVAVCGPLKIPVDASSDVHHGPTRTLRAGGATAEMRPADEPVAVITITAEQSLPLRNFYLREMRPFLQDPSLRHPTFGDREMADATFEGVRKLLPRAARATLKDLEQICEEERQLARQLRLHGWLHTWLLVHVPLSIALLLLGAAHVVIALRY